MSGAAHTALRPGRLLRVPPPLKICFLSACRMLGVFHLAGRLTRKKLLVLCYHGFETAHEGGFKNIFIRKDTFRRQLEIIKQSGFPVVALGDALAGLKNGSLADNSIVITIDDGLYGTYAVAAPLLKSHSMPATIYVNSGFMLRETPVFRLVVYYMFERTREPVLRLREAGWGEDRDVDLGDRTEADRAMWQCINYSEQKCSESEREEICRRLGEALKVDYAPITKSRMLSLMSRSEVAALSRNGFDIQLHTHTHNFPVGNRAAAMSEIAENRKALEPLVSAPLVHFCYPDGIWDRSQWPWLEELGIESAVTCDYGLNSRETPPLALRRFVVSADMPDIEFRAALWRLMPMLRQAQLTLWPPHG